jgi:DUF971 family protein
MEPKELQVLESDGIITILWSDSHKSKYSFAKLRSECPCALCKGEPGVFGRYYEPRKNDIESSVLPDEIESVGRYGLKIAWSDKHDLGIYTFDYLREICECGLCVKQEKEK